MVATDPRPDLAQALDALLADIALRVPDLAHVRASSVLVVAGEARDVSRATVRSLVGPRGPVLVLDGEPKLYEVTLRPLFFQDANGLGRLVTLLHELFHCSTAWDGTLAEERRHASGADFDGRMEEMARSYARQAPPDMLMPLGHDGEVLMRQWRIRPGHPLGPKRQGSEALFMGPVRMSTPPGQRTVWW